MGLTGDRLEEALKLKGTNTLTSATEIGQGEAGKLVAKYKEVLKTKYERSYAIKRVLITLLKGSELEQALQEYVKRSLEKGVPSLGSDLMSLVTNKGGVKVKSPKEIKEHDMFKVIEKVIGGSVSTLTGTPQMWAKYVKVQQLEVTGMYEEALTLLEECISVVEDPKEAVDLHERKGRLLKLMGDIEGACEVLDKARESDLADRYINNKTTKYLLRAGKEEQAEKTIGLFTRHESNAVNNLFEMQCSWFELEYARAMQSKEDYGRALKKYAAVDQHFQDFAEDQFDFHNYCVRRVTLRSYVAILKLEDHIWDHKLWANAAVGAVKCYLWALDNPSAAAGGDGGEVDFSKMSGTEKKKAKHAERKRKKKEEEKKKREEEEKKGKEKEGGEKDEKKEEGKKEEYVDPDPKGLKLLEKDAMKECERYVDMMKLHCPDNLETWLTRGKVYLRKEGDAAVKELCSCIAKGKELDGGDERVWELIVEAGIKAGKEGWGEEWVKANGGGVGTVGEEVEEMIKVDGLGELGLKFKVSLMKMSKATGARGEKECGKFVLEGGLDAEGGHLWKNVVMARAGLEGVGDKEGVKSWEDLAKKKFGRAKW